MCKYYAIVCVCFHREIATVERAAVVIHCRQTTPAAQVCRLFICPVRVGVRPHLCVCVYVRHCCDINTLPANEVCCSRLYGFYPHLRAESSMCTRTVSVWVSDVMLTLLTLCQQVTAVVHFYRLYTRALSVSRSFSLFLSFFQYISLTCTLLEQSLAAWHLIWLSV